MQAAFQINSQLLDLNAQLLSPSTQTRQFSPIYQPLRFFEN